MMFVRFAIAVAVAGLSPSLAPAAAPAKPADDVLVVGAVAEPQTLDPQAAVSPNDMRIVANVFDGLVRFKRGSLDVAPALAASWTVSPDGLVWRFILRDGIRFQDGTPCDAAAVEYTFERMLDPKHPEHATGSFPLAFTFGAIESVHAIDATTVEFRLRQPYAPLLSALATPTGSIVSPTAVKKYGAEFGRHPVGTGAFAFESWTPNTEVALAANGAFVGEPPTLKRLVFRPIADPRARRTALQSGQIDVMMDAPFRDLPEIGTQAGFTVATTTAPHLWFLILNTREGPLSDKRVRQAVNYAIDKRRIVEDVLGGGAEVAGDPVPSAFDWADDKSLRPYPYDPAKARELIRQAGAEGARLSFLVAQNGVGMLDPGAMADAIERDLEAVGLDVKVQTYDWTTFLANVNPGLSDRADMAEMAWTTQDPDTLPFLALRSGAMPNEGGFNAGYYSNPEVDRLVEAARRIGDRKARAALYRDLQRIVQDDAPFAFVASERENAVAGPSVQGLRIEPSSIVLFSKVRKE
nr:ABC transporter substrate-binding protein [Aureimonas leprariae]